MPKCKNDESKSYKGDEPSPKGLGYCARGEKEGSRKKGKDGNMWEVKKVSSGSKRWIKIIKESKQDVDKWIKKNILKGDIKQKLKNVDVHLFVEKNYGRGYGIDEFFDKIKEKLEGKNSDDNSYLDYSWLLVIIDLRDGGTTKDIKEVVMQHNGIMRQKKKEVISIFKEIFKGKYLWNGSQSKVMTINI